MSAEKTALVIGWGDQGPIASSTLLPGYELAICDPDPKSEIPEGLRIVQHRDLGRVANEFTVVMDATPLTAAEGLEGLVKTYKDLDPEVVLIGLPSAQEYLYRLWKQEGVLEPGAERMLVHTLYGPNSKLEGHAAIFNWIASKFLDNSLKGREIAITYIDGVKTRDLVKEWHSRRAVIKDEKEDGKAMTPEYHDKASSWQALAASAGWSMAKVKRFIDDSLLTPSARRVVRLRANGEAQSPALVDTICSGFNMTASVVELEFNHEFSTLLASLNLARELPGSSPEELAQMFVKVRYMSRLAMSTEAAMQDVRLSLADTLAGLKDKIDLNLYDQDRLYDQDHINKLEADLQADIDELSRLLIPPEISDLAPTLLQEAYGDYERMQISHTNPSPEGETVDPRPKAEAVVVSKRRARSEARKRVSEVATPTLRGRVVSIDLGDAQQVEMPTGAPGTN